MLRCSTVVVLLAAWSGSTSPDPMTMMMEDAAPTPPEVDASVCTPLMTCEWLTPYQRHIVGSLAGAEDISPGLRLAHRASVGEREATRKFLIDELAALGLTAMRHSYVDGSFNGENVIATLAGT